MSDEKTFGAGNLPPSDQAVVDAATAAINALNGDPNYCSSVGQTGTAVNSAVHDFKVAWNGVYTDQPLPYNGQYDQQTKDALDSEQTGLSTPAVCAPQPPQPPTPPQPPPGPIVPSGGMPSWLRWLLVALAAGAVIFAGVMIYRGSKKRGGSSGASEAPRRRKRKKRKGGKRRRKR